VRAVKFGYKNVYILPSGIMGWEKAGMPVDKGA
jgi:rhodanese-related sulfurtransferase